MLAQKFRFNRRNFPYKNKRFKSFRSGGFLFLYNPQQLSARVAVVISKKCEKSAVNRNRFRRQTYEIIRTILLPSVPPLHLVCLYKGTKIPENAQDIKNAIQQLKTKLKI